MHEYSNIDALNDGIRFLFSIALYYVFLFPPHHFLLLLHFLAMSLKLALDSESSVWDYSVHHHYWLTLIFIK